MASFPEVDVSVGLQRLLRAMPAVGRRLERMNVLMTEVCSSGGYLLSVSQAEVQAEFTLKLPTREASASFFHFIFPATAARDAITVN